ncbi:MAG TPA: sulfurtransferase, partial [Trueperaceae bacterium]|nr:sulfurtransferase [Trueperaceae bacterium]
LLDPLAGAALYAAGHVPGAVHLDLDKDLSGPLGAGGGRHPLPDMHVFVATLGERGVGRGNEIVVYDQMGGMYAARAWWLLRYAGHDQVRFLDGGLREYTRAGGPLTTDVPRRAQVTFALDLRPAMVATAAEVLGRLDDPTLVLLDARAPERYRGEVEPLDAKAGHIPGARNLPYTEVLEAGRFLPPGRLGDRLAGGLGDRLAGRLGDRLAGGLGDRIAVQLADQQADRSAGVTGAVDLEADNVVAYCGSGVSAAQVVLAFEVAGMSGVRLYPGSWSEWSSDPAMPVATGGRDGVAVVD